MSGPRLILLLVIICNSLRTSVILSTHEDKLTSIELVVEVDGRGFEEVGVTS